MLDLTPITLGEHPVWFTAPKSAGRQQGLLEVDLENVPEVGAHIDALQLHAYAGTREAALEMLAEAREKAEA